MAHDRGGILEPLFFLAQVEKENVVIQELKNHLHQLPKLSENSLLRTKKDAKKQQKADFRASQGRVAKTQQEILLLQAQFNSLVVENWEAEQALRKVPRGSGAVGAMGPLGQGRGRREGQAQGLGWGAGLLQPPGAQLPEEKGAGKPRMDTVSLGRQEGAAHRPGTGGREIRSCCRPAL